MTAPTIRTEYSVGRAGVAGESETVSYNTREPWNGTSRLVICLHGHGTVGQDLNNSNQFGQNSGFAGQAVSAMARTGRYIICAIQAGGSSSWSKPAVMANIDSAVTALRARGARSGKYGLVGYSMGGLEAANKLKRDSANIAAVWLWNPVLDLDFVYSTAGHTPIANNAQWTSEVDASFGSYAATAGYRVSDEYASFRGLGVPVKIVHATNDATVNPLVSTNFVSGVADPSITMRSPDVLGDHTGVFVNIPDAEVLAHFDSASW